MLVPLVHEDIRHDLPLSVTWRFQKRLKPDILAPIKAIQFRSLDSFHKAYKSNRKTTRPHDSPALAASYPSCRGLSEDRMAGDGSKVIRCPSKRVVNQFNDMELNVCHVQKLHTLYWCTVFMFTVRTVYIYTYHMQRKYSSIWTCMKV